jgi:flagellar protein FlaI
LYRDGKQIRRCNEVVEIVGMSETKDVIVNTVFKYRPDTDSVVYSARSEIYDHIAEISGNDMNWISREQQRRAMVIEAMIDQRIRDYRDVSEILWRYYAMPDLVLSSLNDLSVLLERGIMAPSLHRNMKADLDTPLV